jgi:cell division protein ZapA (FtsZ GTPase activity inhibitor)
MTNEDRTRVTVEIYGAQYKLVGTSSKDYVKIVADYVNDHMVEIAKGNPRLDVPRIAVLAAVHMAEQVMDSKRNQENIDRLKDAHEKLQNELHRARAEQAVQVEQAQLQLDEQKKLTDKQLKVNEEQLNHIEGLKSEHQEKLTQAELQQQEQLKKLESEQQQAMSKMEQQYKEKLSELESKQNSQLTSLQGQWNAAKKESSDLRSQLGQITQREQALKSNETKLKNTISQLESQLTAAKNLAEKQINDSKSLAAKERT